MQELIKRVTEEVIESNKSSQERKFLVRKTNGEISVICDKFATPELISTDLTLDMVIEMSNYIEDNPNSKVAKEYTDILNLMVEGKINGAVVIEAYLNSFNKATFGLNNRKMVLSVLPLLDQEGTYYTKIINRIDINLWKDGCVLPMYYEKIDNRRFLLHCDGVYYDHRNKCWIITECVTEEGTGRKFMAFKRVWWK